MNLAEMLCYADIAQLSNIADTYGCECSSHSKNELIQSILSAVQRREVLDQRVQEMSLEDIRFLNSLLFERRASYSLEDLTARAASSADKKPTPAASAGIVTTKPESRRSSATSRIGASGAAAAGKRAGKGTEMREPENTARSAIARFKRFGWLFTGISQQTKYLYQVPDDVKIRLRDALDREFRRGLELGDEPLVYRDERGLISEDLVLLLRFVRDQDVLLTADGYLYKRQLQQLLDGLSVQESIPGKSAFRFGYGRRYREYPDRFSLLYDYAYYAGYMDELADRLVLTEQGQAAARGEVVIDAADLYRFWLRLYKIPVPNLQAITQWMMRLAGGTWVKANSISSILLPLLKPYYYDSEQSILEQRIVAMMMHLGLLRVGESAMGETLLRMTPQGVALVSGQEINFEDMLPWSYATIDSG